MSKRHFEDLDSMQLRLVKHYENMGELKPTDLELAQIAAEEEEMRKNLRRMEASAQEYNREAFDETYRKLTEAYPKDRRDYIHRNSREASA